MTASTHPDRLRPGAPEYVGTRVLDRQGDALELFPRSAEREPVRAVGDRRAPATAVGRTRVPSHDGAAGAERASDDDRPFLRDELGARGGGPSPSTTCAAHVGAVKGAEGTRARIGMHVAPFVGDELRPLLRSKDPPHQRLRWSWMRARIQGAQSSRGTSTKPPTQSFSMASVEGLRALGRLRRSGRRAQALAEERAPDRATRRDVAARAALPGCPAATPRHAARSRRPSGNSPATGSNAQASSTQGLIAAPPTRPSEADGAHNPSRGVDLPSPRSPPAARRPACPRKPTAAPSPSPLPRSSDASSDPTWTRRPRRPRRLLHASHDGEVAGTRLDA